MSINASFIDESPKLWSHQIETVKRYKELDYIAYNGSDPGTGKTMASIHAIEEMGAKALILAPKTLLESAWLQDWATYHGLKPEDLLDGYVSVAWARNRKQAFTSPVERAVITNFEAVNAIAKNPAWIKGFDIVVVDEATAFKNYSATRSKNARKVLARFKHRILMSGTPWSRSVEDLWHQFLLLDHGQRLGRSLTRFRAAYRTPYHPPGAPVGVVQWEDREGAAERVAEAVADLMIQHRLDEVRDIPPVHIYRLGVPVSRRSIQTYHKMARERVLQDRDSIVSAVHAASLRQKLLQLSAGAVYGEDQAVVRVGEERAEIVAELVAERRHPCLVFFWWKHQKDSILEALAKAGVGAAAVIDGETPSTERARIVRRMQDGELRCLLIHPQTGAHGLTLTRARTVIFTAPPGDRADLVDQAIARVRRAGQTEKTEAIILETPGTLEPRVWEALLNKRDASEAFKNYVEELL